MVTVAWLGVPWVTPVGSEVSSIVSIKFSSGSNVSSSFIGTSNVATVAPAGIVAVYGPEV